MQHTQNPNPRQRTELRDPDPDTIEDPITENGEEDDDNEPGLPNKIRGQGDLGTVPGATDEDVAEVGDLGGEWEDGQEKRESV
jgi:hypothetical protein